MTEDEEKANWPLKSENIPHDVVSMLRFLQTKQSHHHHDNCIVISGIPFVRYGLKMKWYERVCQFFNLGAFAQSDERMHTHGYRWETDNELRRRVRQELKSRIER